MKVNVFTIVTLIVIAIIVFSTIWYLYLSGSWPDVEGRIAHIELEEISVRPGFSPGTSNEQAFEYKVHLDYHYTVDGKAYVGHNLYAKMPNIFHDSSIAKQTIQQFPVDALVRVYYDPENPSNSCLFSTKNIPLKGFIVLTLLVVVVLGLIGGGLYFFSKF